MIWTLLAVPHIEYRVRDGGMACPRCGESLWLHEFRLGQASTPDEVPRWLVARRYCEKGCILLAGDLDSLYLRSLEGIS